MSSSAAPALIVQVGTRTCAIPVQHVSEIMRPLPIEILAGAPSFVRGVSVLRGAAVLVLDLEALLEGGAATGSYGRFVAVKIDERRLALAVDAVVGLRSLAGVALETLPPLLEASSADTVEALGVQDARLLLLLRTARVVPEEAWAALDSAGAMR